MTGSVPVVTAYQLNGKVGNDEAGAAALKPRSGGFRLYEGRLVDDSERGARVRWGPINGDMHDRLFHILSEIRFKIVGIFEASDPQPARTTK